MRTDDMGDGGVRTNAVGIMNEKDVIRSAGREVIDEFLNSHDCFEVIRQSGKVVVFDTKIPIQLAFYALVEHGRWPFCLAHFFLCCVSILTSPLVSRPPVFVRSAPPLYFLRHASSPSLGRFHSGVRRPHDDHRFHLHSPILLPTEDQDVRARVAIDIRRPREPESARAAQAPGVRWRSSLGHLDAVLQAYALQQH